MTWESRFWSKVEKSVGCWNWTRSKTQRGYGKFKVGGVSRYAHHITYEMANGSIPDGMVVCHKCDNPSCVNPSHLFVGTQSENIKDAMRKRRRPHMRGLESRYAKLTETQVVEIRRRHKAGGVTQRALAKEFGVSHKTISKIVNNLRWAHLHEPRIVEREEAAR